MYQRENGLMSDKILNHFDKINIKTEMKLNDLGYSYRESVIIRSKLVRKYLNYYQKIFHCDNQTKTHLKTNFPNIYRRILISRYRMLYDFLK